MKHFTIVSNVIKDEKLQLAYQIKEKILEKSPSATVQVCEMEECSKFAFGETEVIMVLGGDGTLIRVAKEVVKDNIPVIGVNLGAVGFLAEVELGFLDEAIDKLLKDEYFIEERMMLVGDSKVANENDEVCIALNDVVLSRRGDLQIIGYRVFVNGMRLYDYYADGMIVSTPTGSTGYNMSAGGSIVEPNAKLIVLTPVAPHTLNARGIMLSANDEVEIEVLSPKGMKSVEVGIYYDGNGSRILKPGDRVRVKKYDTFVKICRISDAGFLEVLQKKMNS